MKFMRMFAGPSFLGTSSSMIAIDAHVLHAIIIKKSYSSIVLLVHMRTR